MRGLLFIGLLAQLAGCQNSCQSLCGQMADYAEECGYGPISDADIDACVDGQKGSELEKGDRGVCRDFNDPLSIRAQWRCEDLLDYFVPAASETAAGG